MSCAAGGKKVSLFEEPRSGAAIRNHTPPRLIAVKLIAEIHGSGHLLRAARDEAIIGVTGDHHGFALAVHGGAGTLNRGDMTVERERLYHAGLRRALAAGYSVLADGGGALDAAIASVCALEDEPLFNAGRGAVFTRAGTQEMDAAVMDGRQRRAGAVAGIFGPRNPILAARAVMDKTPHVLLVADGAARFCRENGLDFAEPEYFATEARRQALAETLALEASGRAEIDEARRHGTVGAVACDRAGNLAAATSTGGMTGKFPGRVGDSAIIGAGTFADNATCAVSATGHGEFFIRYAAAHEVSARIAHRGQPLAEAATAVVADLARLGGSGGLIAVDRTGDLSLPFNCAGMYRGYVKDDGIVYTALYDEAYKT